MPIQRRPIDQLIAYSDALRDKGEPTRADEVLVEAVVARPLYAPELLATLRRTMRGMRADRVTQRLMQTPIELRAGVTRALLDRRCEPEATMLLDSICAASDEDVAKVLTMFDTSGAMDGDGHAEGEGEGEGEGAGEDEGEDEGGGDGDARGPRICRPGAEAADILCQRVLSCSPSRYDALLARLYARGPAGPAARAAAHLVAAKPLHAVDLAIAFHRDGLPQGSASLLAHILRRTPPPTIVVILAGLDDSARREIHTSLFAALTQCPNPHVLISALRQGGQSAEADRMPRTVAERGTPATLALLHTGLLSLGAHRDAETIVARAGARADVTELCETLHRTSQHRLAYLIAEQQS